MLAQSENAGDYQLGVNRSPNTLVAEKLVLLNHSLDQLHVSHMISAEDFFSANRGVGQWSSLRSLALTSGLFHRSGDSAKISKLLCEAACAAVCMRKLESLVIWNGRRDDACAFIYSASEHDVVITWRGTWELELSARVQSTWEYVARKVQNKELRISQETIRESIMSHGDAIHHLRLPCQVIDPTSLVRMRREDKEPVVEEAE